MARKAPALAPVAAACVVATGVCARERGMGHRTGVAARKPLRNCRALVPVLSETGNGGHRFRFLGGNGRFHAETGRPFPCGNGTWFPPPPGQAG
eukprot:354114-Chlamydomonas_euryale.AAC.8